ncbi:MAG TPA: LuxR C-terminal-related transcriptional regulator [Mucilaginibacter sp.]|jgi:DNA-binding CsgD family transcriptional regulator
MQQANGAGTQHFYSIIMEFKQEELLEREIEIGHYLIRDFSLKMIAVKTGLNKKIITAHVSNMMEKLKVTDMNELIKLIKESDWPVQLSFGNRQRSFDYSSIHHNQHKDKRMKNAFHISSASLLVLAYCFLVFAWLYYFALLARMIFDANLHGNLFNK